MEHWNIALEVPIICWNNLKILAKGMYFTTVCDGACWVEVPVFWSSAGPEGLLHPEDTQEPQPGLCMGEAQRYKKPGNHKVAFLETTSNTHYRSCQNLQLTVSSFHFCRGFRTSFHLFRWDSLTSSVLASHCSCIHHWGCYPGLNRNN